ncbi:MAG: Coenzyme F420 hydrogenase/dehydrogenase, beta subunit C-terminal domain [Candidatus Helarchaeota archaeon]
MTEKVKEEEQFNKSFEYLKVKLEGGKDSFGKLMKEIVDTGICTKCSACVGTCDVLVWDLATDRPKLVGKCTGCGICYNQCPRTFTSLSDIIGSFKVAYTAQSLNEKIKGQDGGVVTALLAYGLSEGLLDCAIVTKKDKEKLWYPVPTIVTNLDDLYDSAGSVYIHSQTVNKLMEAIRAGYHSIGFVGTPCNVDAVAKMQESTTGMLHAFMRTNILNIGLFCMESFTYEGLTDFLKANGSNWDEVVKCTIERGQFVFHLKPELGKDNIARKVHTLVRYAESSCSYCGDLTSENADISVGSIGSAAGWSTVLVRNNKGYQYLIDAAEKGWIKLEPLANKKINLLKNIAKRKKQSIYKKPERKTVIFITKVATGEPKKITPAGKEDIIAAAKRKLVKLTKSKAIPAEKIYKVDVINSSGQTLDNVKIKISNHKDLTEIETWEYEIPIWYPFEELSFEVPWTDPQSEFLVELNDQKGLMLSRGAKLEKLLAPKE